MKKLSVLLLLCGCATIVDGGPDTINLMTSDGSQVRAQVNSKIGLQTVYLPTIISVPKSCQNITISVIEDEKNQRSSAIVSSGVNPWVVGNIIFGGFIGLAVDGLSGKICTYDNTAIVQINHK